MHSPNDPLDPLLDRWNKIPSTPPNLRSEVWRRIAVAEETADSGSLWARLEAVFTRPSFAFTFITACMLAGLFFAEVRLSRIHAERNALYAKSYLRLIDPLVTDLSGAETKDVSDKS